MEILSYTGEKALFFMSQSINKRYWQGLFDQSPWVTVFQDFEWVKWYYELYCTKIDPLILVGKNQGEILGVFPLCITAKGVITGAGQQQAEYHACICDEQHLKSFVEATIQWVSDHHKGLTIHLKYLPYTFPKYILDKISIPAGFSYHKKHSVPLIPLQQEYFENELNKKNKKEKLRRLRKLGELSFVKIERQDQLNELMPSIIAQHDFRKGAMYGKEYFLEDPLKEAFMKGLFQRNLLHVTALFVGEEMIASHGGAYDDQTIYLQGFNAHSPMHAKYSPGILQLLMLGNQVTQEDLKFFDLTPGGVSGYKSDLATQFEECQEWMFSPSRAKCWSLMIKDTVKDKVEQWLPEQFYVYFTKDYLATEKKEKKKAIKSFQQWGWKGYQRRIAEINEPVGHYYSEKITIEMVSMFGSENFTWNGLEDLLCYQEKEGVMTKRAFLTDAMRRLEYGHKVLTCVRGGSLLFCLWYVPEGSKALQKGIEKVPHAYVFMSKCVGNVQMHDEFLSAGLYEVLKKEGLEEIEWRSKIAWGVGEKVGVRANDEVKQLVKVY
jgi:CelD/BcsL family acetyltransferase involved in cellulose biosynthesis